MNKTITMNEIAKGVLSERRYWCALGDLELVPSGYASTISDNVCFLVPEHDYGKAILYTWLEELLQSYTEDRRSRFLCNHAEWMGYNLFYLFEFIFNGARLVESDGDSVYETRKRFLQDWMATCSTEGVSSDSEFKAILRMI